MKKPSELLLSPNFTFNFSLFTSCFSLFILFLFSACHKYNSPQGPSYTSSPVPYVKIQDTININDYQYNALLTVGNVIYINNIGYRGIILYSISSTSILAFDRTCTYDIPDPNGIVYNQFNLTVSCPDCGSIYNLSNGSVNTGPSTIGLQSYATSFNPITGMLIITH